MALQSFSSFSSADGNWQEKVPGGRKHAKRGGKEFGVSIGHSDILALSSRGSSRSNPDDID